MPNPPGFSWTNTSATVDVTLDGLVATMKKLKPPPRDVFVFGGTMTEFKAALDANGVEVQAEAPADLGMPCSPFGTTFPPLFSLGCYEVNGEVWVATNYRDVEDAMAGKLPFQRIGAK